MIKLKNSGTNLRKYGNPPFNVAVIHGGPGGAGQIAPVARELSGATGILEPFQTKLTIDELLDELKQTLQDNTSQPVTLIGHSWGSILSFIFAAKHPYMVKKLILVSSAVFDDKYANTISPTRLGRMTGEEKAKLDSLVTSLDKSKGTGKNRAFELLGEFITKIDSYDPISLPSEIIECRHDIYTSIWKEALDLRKRGELTNMGKQIQCPVVAIHGDYDPRSARGIKIPLSAVLKDFNFIILKKCGHTPWIEAQAKDDFYRVLRKELKAASPDTRISCALGTSGKKIVSK